MSRDAAIARLRRDRPRNTFVRSSLALALLLILLAWLFGGFDWGDLFSVRRQENLARFFREIRPFPLQGRAWDWGIAIDWARTLFRDRGAAAMATTFAISLVAIVLAGLASFVLSLPAARNFMTPNPFASFAPATSRPRQAVFALLRTTTRFTLTLLRSVPEYVLAFLLLAILGPTPWTAILALAIHNAGILGRLGAESVENIATEAPVALRGLGAGRFHIAAWAILPELLPRLLLYFFYRWETCVRESTILGLLGIVSIGFWIDDARTRGQMDVLVYFVALGTALVILVDALSSLAREALRRAA